MPRPEPQPWLVPEGLVSVAPAAEKPAVANAAPAYVPDPLIQQMDWDELEAHVKAQSRGEALQAVFGTGVRDADLFVIGEAPGADEEREGEPCVGRAGQPLDQMLRAIGAPRQDNVYIAHIFKLRPPNNRDPKP